MQEVRFNGEKYTSDIKISRLDGSTFTEQVVLFEDNISKVGIINDLYEPLLRFELYFKDPQGDLIPRYPIDGFSYINYELVFYETKGTGQSGKSSTKSSSKPVQLSHNFIINNVEIVSKTNEEVMFKITAVSEYVPVWLSHIWYSNNNKDQSTTKTIEDILAQSKLPFNKDSKLVHSTNQGPYITTVNDTISNNIETLLRYSNEDLNGLYYLIYSMIDNYLKILHVNQVFNSGEIPGFNGIKIPTKFGFSTLESIATEETINNYLRGINMYNYASKVTLNNFDYLQREWTKDEYEFNRIKNFLPKSKSIAKTEYTFQDVPDKLRESPNYKFQYEMQPIKYFFLSDRISELYRFADVLEFNCAGYIGRDVGQLFSVSLDNAKQALYQRLIGTWMISRITHVFTKGSYRQDISLVRSDRMVRLDASGKTSKSSNPDL